jgi:hypothetical protein
MARIAYEPPFECSTSNTFKVVTDRVRTPIMKSAMEDYKGEDWVSLYQAALTELEQAKMLDRITAAQDAVVDRLERLRIMPGLHPEERHAIEDAIRTLGFLEREDARFDEEAERRAVQESLEKLRSVGNTIQRLRERANNPE